MTKGIKRITGLLLSAVMLLGCLVPAVSAQDAGDVALFNAADAEEAADFIADGSGIAANIILPGISQSNSVYCDENGEPVLNKDGGKFEGGLLILDTTYLVRDIFKNLLFPLLSTIFTQHTSKKLASGVRATIDDLFSIQRSDREGNAVNNLVVDTYKYPLSEYSQDDRDWFYRRLPMEPVIEAMNEKYGVDGEKYTYLYTFPLIGDPITSAEGLFDFIELVKEQSGCEKVNLIAISMGGSILAAYLDLVRERGGDYSDINKIVNIVACLDGADLFADFYARSWNLDDEFLYGTYVPAIMTEEGNDEWLGHLINIVLRILPKKALYTVLTAAFDGILDDLILYCPQFWAVVPSDRYEELADRYFSTEDMAVMRQKTDRMQQCRLNLKDNLSAAAEGCGVEVYSVAGYGRQYVSGDYCFLGIAASSEVSNSDSIIDIDSTTLGTTYAIAGQTLGYTGEYVSPDGEIDASTAMFPDTTWYFYRQHHEVGRDDVIIRLLGEIIVDNVKDVNSSEAFPQFNHWRNTRELYRSDNGLMVKARTVLANENGEYTEEQIETVRPVYEKVAAFIDRTVLDENSQADAEALTRELNDALACTGLTTKTEEPKWYTNVLNKIFISWDKRLMKNVGGQGFSDKIREILGLPIL